LDGDLARRAGSDGGDDRETIGSDGNDGGRGSRPALHASLEGLDGLAPESAKFTEGESDGLVRIEPAEASIRLDRLKLRDGRGSEPFPEIQAVFVVFRILLRFDHVFVEIGDCSDIELLNDFFGDFSTEGAFHSGAGVREEGNAFANCLPKGFDAGAHVALAAGTLDQRIDDFGPEASGGWIMPGARRRIAKHGVTERWVLAPHVGNGIPTRDEFVVELRLRGRESHEVGDCLRHEAGVEDALIIGEVSCGVLAGLLELGANLPELFKTGGTRTGREVLRDDDW
jgi:hypothetical protein